MAAGHLGSAAEPAAGSHVETASDAIERSRPPIDYLPILINKRMYA
ncbi:hypothetical protein [Natronomonas moolapensis]|nr:hypothetical protein [Natronomonas moolapensis]